METIAPAHRLNFPWPKPEGEVASVDFQSGKHHPDLFSGVESEATIISCHSKLKTQAHPAQERGLAQNHNDRLMLGHFL